MKILIADDHLIVREGLKQIISDFSNVSEIDEVENGFEVLEKVGKKDYDVVIMDITMPGKNGLDTLKEIKKIKPDLPVLILSVHDEEQYGFRVLKAGASGFIPKNSDPEEFKKAILKAVEGKKYLSDNLSEKLATNLYEGRNVPIHEILSDREFQVFKSLADGKSLKDISEELFLSVKTISTYRSRILEKINLKNNSELIRYAIEHKIFE
jgi:DNA-binding NarL/FixJ family response regulator